MISRNTILNSHQNRVPTEYCKKLSMIWAMRTMKHCKINETESLVYAAYGMHIDMWNHVFQSPLLPYYARGKKTLCKLKLFTQFKKGWKTLPNKQLWWTVQNFRRPSIWHRKQARINAMKIVIFEQFYNCDFSTNILLQLFIVLFCILERIYTLNRIFLTFSFSLRYRIFCAPHPLRMHIVFQINFSFRLCSMVCN